MTFKLADNIPQRGNLPISSMLQVDFTNLFEVYKYNRNCGLSADDLEISAADSLHYRNLVRSRNQGFIDLPENREVVTEILAFASRQQHFQHFVVLGIGGSMLGPQTIIEALVPELVGSRVIFLDNIDPYITKLVTQKLNLASTLFLVQTKSGGTPETVAQYVYFKDQVQAAGLNWLEHFVFVTDPNEGWLRQIARTDGVPAFSVPPNVGGRFSVLTPIGLLIAALVGLDIAKMLQGAAEVVEREFNTTESQDALRLAKATFLLAAKGKTNLVIMPYSSRLRTLADWCVQLLSESTGKQFNRVNQEVYAGITPIPALGATDQHSQLQLFKEGPNDKQILFIEVQDHLATIPVPTAQLASNQSLNYLQDQTFNSLLAAELEGTRRSLTESLRPNVTLHIDRVDEANLGALFMFFELYVAFLGELLNIDVFNQPGVERSKVLTRELLSRSV